MLFVSVESGPDITSMNCSQSKVCAEMKTLSSSHLWLEENHLLSSLYTPNAIFDNRWESMQIFSLQNESQHFWGFASAGFEYQLCIIVIRFIFHTSLGINHFKIFFPISLECHFTLYDSFGGIVFYEYSDG